MKYEFYIVLEDRGALTEYEFCIALEDRRRKQRSIMEYEFYIALEDGHNGILILYSTRRQEHNGM